MTEQLITAGMNPAHLSAAGYSEYEPARENSTEAGRRENRRIGIVLLPNLAEIPVPRGTRSAGGSVPAPGAGAVASGRRGGPPSVPDAAGRLRRRGGGPGGWG